LSTGYEHPAHGITKHAFLPQGHQQDMNIQLMALQNTPSYRKACFGGQSVIPFLVKTGISMLCAFPPRPNQEEAASKRI
jgi:hypothetical protein